MTNDRRMVLALMAIAAIWALTFPLSRIAVLGGYRAFGLIFWSSLIGAVLLLGVLLRRREALPLTRAAVLRYVYVALLGTVLPSAASYTAAIHLQSGILSLCMALIPLIALPLAVILGTDRFTGHRALGLLLGLAGVLMLIGPEASLPDRGAALFLPLGLLAAFFYALEGAGLGRIGSAGLTPIQLLFGALVFSTVLSLPIALVSGTLKMPMVPFDKADLSVLLSGLVNVAAYCGYVWIIGRAGSVFAAQVAYLVTGFGVLWSMILLGESYSIWIWAAMGTIFAGLMLVRPRTAEPLVTPAAEAMIAANDKQAL